MIIQYTRVYLCVCMLTCASLTMAMIQTLFFVFLNIVFCFFFFVRERGASLFVRVCPGAKDCTRGRDVPYIQYSIHIYVYTGAKDLSYTYIREPKTVPIIDVCVHIYIYIYIYTHNLYISLSLSLYTYI